MLENLTADMRATLESFWFNHPEVDVTITDNLIVNKVKTIGLEAFLNTRENIIYDSILSNYLSTMVSKNTTVYVCYILKSESSKLINLINKRCNSSIDPKTICLRINAGRDVFVFANYHGNRSWQRSLTPISSLCDRCRSIQSDYWTKYPHLERPSYIGNPFLTGEPFFQPYIHFTV